MADDLAAMAAQVYGEQAPTQSDAALTVQWAKMMDPNFRAPKVARTVVAPSWGAGPAWGGAAAWGAGVVIPPPVGGFGKGAYNPNVIKGKGKGKMQGEFRPENDAIYLAVGTAMQGAAPEELATPGDGVWDEEALKKRLAKYFRGAAKGLSFTDEPHKVINDFADNALGNVAWALQGAKWLATADLTLVLEVSIDELFPQSFKQSVPADAPLQDLILQAHDRALEEARFAPILMDAVKETVEGKKSVNKVYNAVEAARKDVVAAMFTNVDESKDFFYCLENGVTEKIQEFVGAWISSSIKALGDWPEGVIEAKDAQKLFDKLLSREESCLPRSIVRYMVEPLPEPWEFVADTIKGIYKSSATSNAVAAASSAKKRKAEEGPNFLYKTTWCRNMMTEGMCKMGDWCVFAHHEGEMAVHKGLKGAMMKGGKGKGPYGYSGSSQGKGKGDMKGGKPADFRAMAIFAASGKGCKKGKARQDSSSADAWDPADAGEDGEFLA